MAKSRNFTFLEVRAEGLYDFECPIVSVGGYQAFEFGEHRERVGFGRNRLLIGQYGLQVLDTKLENQ